MNSQGFSFPPPPPPPSQQQTQPAYPAASQYGQSYGQRGGWGGHKGGRGRGSWNRGGGGGRGGHFGSSDAAHAQPYSANPAVNYSQMNYGAYAAQGLPTHTPGSLPSSQYAQSHHSSFHAPNQSSFTPQSFSQHASHMPPPPYQRQPGYDAAYSPSTNMPHQMNSYPAHSASSYPSMAPHQQAHPSTHPPMMGPPMHWGFEHAGNTGSYPGNQYGNAGGSWAFNAHGSQTQAGGKGPKHAPKRDHGSAFGKPRSAAPRTPAPPAVPGFGNPLPSKPPPPEPRKKKRKHNQLGLTPKTAEHESSEEDNDVDEESKLAAASGGAATALKFKYRGRTSTLQSPADIAAWIEERKSRFPTQARVAEKKKAIEDAKKAREEAARQKQLKQQESKRLQKEAQEQKEREKHDHKEPQGKPSDPVNAAAKAKQKANKLRRKLMKEEKRVAKAEADAERARHQVESLQNNSTDGVKDATAAGQAASTAQGADGISSQHAASHQETIPEPETAPGESETVDSAAIPPSEEQTTMAEPIETQANDISSPDLSEDSDWTSSSGSDLSSADSEESDADSDDDSAPEEMTARRDGPERVAPPPREDKKRRICRHFARSGRCLLGDKCKFLHEMPERKTKQPMEKKGRKGLLQAVCFNSRISWLRLTDWRSCLTDRRKTRTGVLWKRS